MLSNENYDPYLGGFQSKTIDLRGPNNKCSQNLKAPYIEHKIVSNNYASMQNLQHYQGELVAGDHAYVFKQPPPITLPKHVKNTMSMASVPKKPIFPKSLL